MKITHPFYFIDAPTPVIGGYDLMRAARLVVDVDNRLVWSRRTQPSDQGWATPHPTLLYQYRTGQFMQEC